MLAAMTPPGTGPRIAVVLFNLGGPDRPEAIRPFLVNLFSDPAILRVPALLRPLLARIIAGARLKPATANYALLGGRSPLLELTRRQATALEAALPELHARCFIAMRYWHPFSAAAAREVRGMGSRPGAAAAAVSAVLHHHHRQQPVGMARGGQPCRSGQADQRGLLLPLRSGICRRHGGDRAAQPGAPPAPPPGRARCGCCSRRTGCRR